MKNEKVMGLALAGMLCAVGIVIPMFSPKIVLEPASFTLASHVAVFIAMFLSPSIGVAVALGTTVGFLMGGMPLVVVLRALSHVVFVVVGSLYLRGRKELLSSVGRSLPFSLAIAVIHAAAEVLVVLPFYFGGTMGAANYEKGFFVSVLLLVGVGTAVHSMVDFALSILLWRPISHLLYRGAPREARR